jgi:hypothetical protein
MKLNYFTKQISIVGRWLATALFCVSAIAFIWQGSFFSNPAAMADTNVNLIASVGDRAQDKASEDAGRTKGFVRDTADKVERAARKNSEKVNQADDGGFFGRKAKRDAARIEKRAEEDTARTQKAIDKTKNAFRKAVDND